MSSDESSTHDDPMDAPAESVESNWGEQAAEEELIALDGRVINLWRIHQLIGSAVFLGILFVIGSFVSLSVDGAFIWVAGGWVFFAVYKLISALVYPPLAWKHFGYRVTDQVLEIRSGVFWKLCQQVPLSRLQHVDLQRGPIERSFGLATLTIFTAGTQQATLTIPGLEAEYASEFRDQLVAIGGDDGV